MTNETSFVDLTLTGTGLMAGLLFGYATSVNPGLARVDDRNYLASMQSLNRAIVNPLFVVTFIGAGAATLLAAVLEIRSSNGARAVLLMCGAPWSRWHLVRTTAAIASFVFVGSVVAVALAVQNRSGRLAAEAYELIL